MRTFFLKRFPGVTMHASSDVLHDYKLRLRTNDDGMCLTLEDMLERDYEEMFHERVSTKFHEFVLRYGMRSHRRGIRVLNAHGGTEDGIWKYVDGKRCVSVQSWINRYAPTCAAVVLIVCNRDGNDVVSENGLIFIPDNFVGSGAMFDAFHDLHFTLRLPHGEEIDTYTVDWHLKNVSI